MKRRKALRKARGMIASQWARKFALLLEDAAEIEARDWVDDSGKDMEAQEEEGDWWHRVEVGKFSRGGATFRFTDGDGRLWEVQVHEIRR